MRLHNVLAHIGRLTGTKYTIRNETCFIAAGDPVQPPKPMAGIDIHAGNADLRAKMLRRISFDFQDTPLTDVIAYFRQIDSENYVIMPAVASGLSTVTMKVTEMPMQDAWNWLCQNTGTSMLYIDQALLLDTASPHAADPELPPQVRPANAITF